MIKVDKIEVDKIEPTGRITWVRQPNPPAISAPSVINDTKTYTETTTMNNTKTTAIPVCAPEELRKKKISMEDFCVPVDAFSENKLATEKTPEEKARDAQYSAAHSKMEEEFDRISNENYERIDREVVDAMKETDKECKRADILSGHAPLTYKERKAV